MAAAGAFSVFAASGRAKDKRESELKAIQRRLDAKEREAKEAEDSGVPVEKISRRRRRR